MSSQSIQAQLHTLDGLSIRERVQVPSLSQRA